MYHINLLWQTAMALSQLVVPWFSLGQSIKLSSSPVQLTFVSLGGRLSSPNNPPPRPIAPVSLYNQTNYYDCESVALWIIIGHKSKIFGNKFILKSDKLVKSHGDTKTIPANPP